MKAQFTFLSGARAGQIDVLNQNFIGMGRHPLCELKFDPDKDLDVSSRHASAFLQNDMFVLRDLGSTNGTFVNAKRLTDDHVLADKDVIQFGQNGPKVEFRLLKDAPAEVAPVGAEAGGTSVFPQKPPRASRGANPPPPRRTGGAAPSSGSKPPTAPVASGGSTTTRVRAEVARQTAHLRRTTLGLFGLLVVVTGAYFWQSSASARALEANRREMLLLLDSLIHERDSATANAQLMHEALDSARARAARLAQELRQAPSDPEAQAVLRQKLDLAIKQQRDLSRAAKLDAAAITAANEDAVALIFVQFYDGRTFTGSGFAVRSNPTGSFLLTNKHVVVDTGGKRAERIGVVFNHSNQNFRAEVVSVHPTQDVALIHVTVAKGTPVVKGLVGENPPVQVGEPVEVIGFPLGLDLPMGGDWSKVGVATTLTLGTASKVLPDLIQLDSYGAEGASGSPVFNRNGKVIGLVYGGQKGSNGRIVFAVPIKYGAELVGSN